MNVISGWRSSFTYTFLKRVFIYSRNFYHVIYDGFVGAHAKLLRKESLVRENVLGNDPNPASLDVAIYVHFDRDGAVHDYVLHQLNELVDAGYRIVFVTNSPNLSPESRARVLPLCGELIWRLNVGYDFGAYKDGIAQLKNRTSLDSLILMNDSVYGPFWPLRDTLSKIDMSKSDFWGITDSPEKRHHLQSYFLMFRQASLKSKAFGAFWRNLPYVSDKGWVIRNAEVKLADSLRRGGLRSGTLAPYEQVSKIGSIALSIPDDANADLEIGDTSSFHRFRSIVRSGVPVNPMHFYWDVLIKDFRCPFIKRELILSNPAQIPSASKWREVIRSSSGYDVTMIERHLNI